MYDTTDIKEIEAICSSVDISTLKDTFLNYYQLGSISYKGKLVIDNDTPRETLYNYVIFNKKEVANLG